MVDEGRGGGEVAEEGEDIAFADANVPKLPADLRCALLLLADLVDDQHEASIGAEAAWGDAYLLEFLPPKT